jgi:hypothetical protein
MNPALPALARPAALASGLAAIYVWKMVHVWPPGKEGWIEESIWMIAFHLSCLLFLLPMIVWSIGRIWRHCSRILRSSLLAGSVLLIAATLVVPEIFIKRLPRVRPSPCNDGSTATSDLNGGRDRTTDDRRLGN